MVVKRLREQRKDDKHVPIRYVIVLLMLCAVAWGSRQMEHFETVNVIANNLEYITNRNNNDTDGSNSSDRKLQNDESSSPCKCETEPTVSLASEAASTVGKTHRWDDWPAVAYEEVGHPLVTKGDSFFHHARELYFQPVGPGQNKTLLEEFLEVYKARPDPVNICGIRINHAMALFWPSKWSDLR